MTRRNRRATVVVTSTVLLVFAMAGCGEDADTRSATAGLEDGETVDLADRTFVSTDVRGHDLVEDTSVTLSFESDQVSASAGCNTFMGAASWDDGTLSLDDEELAATMMACSPEQQEQDDWLTGFLASSPALALAGSTLTVGDDVSGMTLEEQ
jgi:heat shock protein HslJ